MTVFIEDYSGPPGLVFSDDLPSGWRKVPFRPFRFSEPMPKTMSDFDRLEDALRKNWQLPFKPKDY